MLHFTLHRQNCLARHHVVPYVPNGKGCAKRKIVLWHTEREYTVSESK
jgi:hypothetical protein